MVDFDKKFAVTLVVMGATRQLAIAGSSPELRQESGADLVKLAAIHCSPH